MRTKHNTVVYTQFVYSQPGFKGLLFALILKLRKKFKTLDFYANRKSMEFLAKLFLKPKRKLEISYETVEGISVAWINKSFDKDRIVIYLHGGSYVAGSQLTHQYFAENLSNKSHIPFVLANYRLAPEFPFPSALHDSITIYKSLLSAGYTPDNIAFAGDSAGAGLAISILLSLEENKLPFPSCAALICPWLDLTNLSDSFSLEAEDVMLTKKYLDKCAEAYVAGKESLFNPLVSPLYASLAHLPPIYVHTAGKDVLRNDGEKFVEKARDSGIQVEHYHNENGFHVYHIFEKYFGGAKQANNLIADYLREYLRV